VTTGNCLPAAAAGKNGQNADSVCCIIWCCYKVGDGHVCSAPGAVALVMIHPRMNNKNGQYEKKVGRAREVRMESKKFTMLENTTYTWKTSP